MSDLRSRRLWWDSAGGAAAGLAAGSIQGVVAGRFDALPAIVRLAGPDSPATGITIHLAISALGGICYAWLFLRGAGNRPESVMSGIACGLLWWILLSLNLVPILLGEGPHWQAGTAATALPDLVGYVLYGTLLGFGYELFAERTVSWVPSREELEATGRPSAVEHRIVIVGGGFAGVATARHLERLFERDENVACTLISETNHLLFTPMLSEVTSGGVEAQHIITPLRAFFGRTQVIRGEVEAIDLRQRAISVAVEGRPDRRQVPFDHLVLAAGAVANFFGLRNVMQHAFTFKSLEDATLVRNHVIEMLERADAEPGPERRRALMTFVIAGGGFAGAELIGGLNDFVRGSLWFYPNISFEDVSLVLVHSGDRVLPELSPELAAYALEKLKTRGVSFKLGVRVADAAPGVVSLSNGERIHAETLVWTAGSTPHPLTGRLGLEVDPRGAVKTDPTLRVPGHRNVWALGDCAAVPDPATGKTYPPTAQHAVRQAAALARNLRAVLRGRPPKPFRYRSLGSLAVLGHHTACAEIRGIKFSGLLAWWLWRAVYLGKLPNLEKKIRVALDWIIDLFFPRDIVQTTGLRRNGKEGHRR